MVFSENNETPHPVTTFISSRSPLVHPVHLIYLFDGKPTSVTVYKNLFILSVRNNRTPYIISKGTHDNPHTESILRSR